MDRHGQTDKDKRSYIYEHSLYSGAVADSLRMHSMTFISVYVYV
jgi:hypothetical protein